MRGTLSVDAEEAQPPPGRQPGRSPLAVTALALAAALGLTTRPSAATQNLYAIVSVSQGSASRAQDLRAFLDWAITTGTAQLAQVNFQPLPASVVTLSQAQIAKIKG